MRTHDMQGLRLTYDMRGKLYVRCPDNRYWLITYFAAEPIDVETHIYGFLCPMCGEGLIWNGRQIAKDLMAIFRDLPDED